jgi:menaquinone-dependent protoporphyrinogen oxidase
MSKRALVAYASKCGSTTEVAEVVAGRLMAKGWRVDLAEVVEAGAPEGYDAVVLGSAVRMGAWLPEAVNYVRKHQARLRKMAVAIFTVHMLAIDESVESEEQRAAYVRPVLQLIQPRVEAFFAGRIDYGRLSLMERKIAEAVNTPEVDRRDWKLIESWADGLAGVLALGVKEAAGTL